MKIKLSLLLVLALAGCNPAPQDQAKDQPVSPSETKEFPIGGYSGDPERDKAAGFTLVGPVYGKQREGILEAAEKVGLPCVYTVGIELDFLGRHGEPPTELDREAIRAEIRQQVEAVMDSPSVAIWYLIPEELRNWRPLEMEYLQLASETIQEVDPKKRPVWMYEPGHRTQGALEKTFPYQQLAGKGVYTNYSNRKTERAWVTWTLQQQAGAIAAVNPTAIPYGILEMYKKKDDVLPVEQIPVWVRHDAYASLVAGVRGMIVYSFARRRGFFDENTPEWNAYYNAWSDVAKELNGPLQLGSVVLAGAPVPSPEFEITAGPTEVTFSISKSGGKEPINVPSHSSAAYSWSNKTYWFLVNSSNEPLTIKIKENENWTPLLEGQPAVNGKELTLPPLAAAVFQAEI